MNALVTLMIRLRIIIVGLFILFTADTFAQTGPGGVGNSTTNVLWLSADTGVYSDAGTTLAADNDNVQQWNDRSGNGVNAINNTAAERPTYQTPILNSLPVIRFSTTGTDDRLLAAGITDGDEATVIVVAQYTSLPSDNPGIIHGMPSGSNWDPNGNLKTIGIWVDDADGNVWGRAIEDDGTLRNIPEDENLSVNNYHIISVVIDYDGTDVDQFVNGATSGAVAMDDPLADWSDFGIGSQGGEGWNGDIAEVIVFNTALNTAQRVIVENYLAAKYGLDGSFGTVDFYDNDNAGNGNYDFDVAGIGRAGGATQTHTEAWSSIARINDPNDLENNEYYIWGHDNGALVPTTSNIPASVDARLTRIWRGSESGGDGISNFDVSFDLTGLGPVVASDLRLLIDTDDDNSFTDETPISGAALVSGNIYQFSNVTVLNNDDRFTLATANDVTTPLPIDLHSFNAKSINNQVLLTWSTSSETNNEHFTIERTKDGLVFEVVDQVPGAGNSQERKDYELIDTNPFQGKSYYRLSQIDYDGTTKYFPMVSVDVAPSQFDFKLYPNPTSGEFDIELEYASDGMETSLSVSDLQGRAIFSFPSLSTNDKVKTTFHITPPVGLLPGVYVVKLTHGQRMFTRKLVVE